MPDCDAEAGRVKQITGEAAGIERDLRAANANAILLTRPGVPVAGLRVE
jgi:hypothetical protein